MTKLGFQLLACCIVASSWGCGSEDSNGGTAGAGAAAGSGGTAGGGATAGSGGSGGTAGGGATAGSGGSGGTAGSGATAGSGGSGGSTLTERRVFVTSQQFDGALGGLDGADAECQKLADQAGLGGTFLAWLSDGTTSPADRFVQSKLPYVLVDGTTIASDWTDLTDSSLDAPIDHDETGSLLPASDNQFVWTATQASGATVVMNCLAFTDNVSSFSPRGRADAVNQQWTLAQGGDCSEPNHLYCFEK